MSNGIKIAIDGPAGSGKSTSARLVAERLKYVYIDTGAMYRAITLWWLRENITNESELIKSLDEISIDLKYENGHQITLLNNEDVSDVIRSNDVNNNVSYISSIPAVRNKLVDLQRKIASNGSVVMDGRDIGTIVFPDAELKIFLIASIDSRAQRRFKELSNRDQSIELETVKAELLKRDELDSSRETSPLRKAEDAVEIDTSELTIEQQVNKICQFALAKIN